MMKYEESGTTCFPQAGISKFSSEFQVSPHNGPPQRREITRDLDIKRGRDAIRPGHRSVSPSLRGNKDLLRAVTRTPPARRVQPLDSHCPTSSAEVSGRYATSSCCPRNSSAWIVLRRTMKLLCAAPKISY